MGEEDKKRERGVAEIVPIRTDGTRPREKAPDSTRERKPNLMDLPAPKKAGEAIAQQERKKTQASV